MTQEQIEQIKIFINSRSMQEAVYKLLLNSYTKKRDVDVYKLAGYKLAIDNLNDAWNEMEGYKAKQEEDRPDIRQIGL